MYESWPAIRYPYVGFIDTLQLTEMPRTFEAHATVEVYIIAAPNNQTRVTARIDEAPSRCRSDTRHLAIAFLQDPSPQRRFRCLLFAEACFLAETRSSRRRAPFRRAYRAVPTGAEVRKWAHRYNVDPNLALVVLLLFQSNASTLHSCSGGRNTNAVMRDFSCSQPTTCVMNISRLGI